MRCPVCLLVVTTDEAVARWASKDIDLGGGSRLRPYVLGPSVVPEIEDMIRSKSEPELTVLAAMAHGKDAGVDKAMKMVNAVAAATRHFEADQQELYVDYVLLSLNDEVRRSLEAMSGTTRQYLSEFARRYFAQGEAAGETKGRANLLLKQLRLKFGPLSESVTVRLQCAPLDDLDIWGERILNAQSIEDVFR
jgi:hypothetical protein